MTASVIDTVRNLLSQFTFQIVPEDIVEDLSCISCRRLTINPYQTYCGCIYCDECVAVHFGSSDNYCSGGREDCREEYITLEKNILKSAVLNRNILRLKVRCPNRLCDSVTELTHMSEHLRVCTKQLMKCPYSNIGCYDDGVTKDAMLTHLHDNSITHSEMLVDLIQNLRNEINELKENFNQNKLDILTLKEESRLKDAEKEQLMNEMKEGMNTLRREIELINKTNTEKEENIRQLGERMQKQDDKLQSHEKDTLDKFKKETESVASVVRSVSALQTRVDELVRVVDGITTWKNTVIAVGRATFKVDGFSAKKTSVEAICSPHFYSHTNGYKLRLLVYPGGQGGIKGTHLSVYIKVCKGEYDDLLEWPCEHSFTISVVNQSSGENHTSGTFSHSTAVDEYKHSYHKPIKEDNAGYGNPSFIPHITLQSSLGLIVDDALLLRCVVTPPRDPTAPLVSPGSQ